MSEANGVSFQDEYEYSEMCQERAANGFQSGMGEIFRRVASITPTTLSSNGALPMSGRA
jgi:hypothetical protein